MILTQCHLRIICYQDHYLNKVKPRLSNTSVIVRFRYRLLPLAKIRHMNLHRLVYRGKTPVP